MLSFDTVLLGFQDLNAKLARLDRAISQQRVLDEAGAILLSRIRVRFLQEQDSSYHPWKPSVAGIRRRLAGGTGTLFDTGTLWRSIQLSNLGGESRLIQTDVPYAKHLTKRWDFLSFGTQDAVAVEGYLKHKVEKEWGA